MSDIKPLNRTTKTLAHVSELSIDFQTLYAAKGSTRCLGRRRYISSNIGMQFKERGEWRHGKEYSTQTPKKSTLFSGQYLRKRSTLDIGVLGYIGIVWPKEHYPEVWSVPPVTPCVCIYNLKQIFFCYLFCPTLLLVCSASIFTRVCYLPISYYCFVLKY